MQEMELRERKLTLVKDAIKEQVSKARARDEDKYEWTIEESIYDPDTLSIIVNFLTAAFTFDDCARRLFEMFPGWFVYKGDNHIALHRQSGEVLATDGTDLNPRLLMIVAKPKYQLL